MYSFRFVSALRGLCFVVLVFCVVGNAVVLHADQTDDRLIQKLQMNIDSPWPGISDPNNAAGVFSYALACLYLDQNVSQANQLLFDFYTNNPIPPKGGGRDEWNGYFWQHILWRAYHDPTSGPRMTAQTRELIEDNMWTWLDTRSKITEAEQNEWIIYDSENHDAMTKGSHMMCLVALKSSPRYGPEAVLGDGGTIAQHLEAWTDFYMRYFRARAREGINVEIACQQYAKYTLGAYYNIMDFTESPELREMVKTFIDLYWADTTSDWLSSGVRGGGQTRCYRDGNYIRAGATYSFHGLMWAYGWHNNEASIQTYTMIQSVSPYRIPDVITACATDTNRPNFLYTSRRFGRGGAWDGNQNYTVVFDGGDSSVRRETYVTPDYSMGSFALDMNKNYIALFDQNRVMGVMLASGVNDRIMIFGHGGSDPTKSFADLNGVTRENCMVVQRDKNANSTNAETQLYISPNAWANRVETNGWFFTRLDNAYCAIKPAGGGYTSEVAGSGMDLTLDDLWAPVIFQMGQASNYTSFTDFQASVQSNALSYASGTMNYTSEAGDTFTFYANSKTTPRVNGATVDLNPTKTYDSPYLSMVHGEDVATFQYGGTNLVMNFALPLETEIDDWEQAFYDAGTNSWTNQWFLDGQVGTVTNSADGMTLTAGAEWLNDSHHMVLWTKDSFTNDVMIEFDYTRLDTVTQGVNIVYIQAEGYGANPYVEDIYQWKDLRETPAMSMYYDYMDTYHISYAAFDNGSGNPYLRARRYLPNASGLTGTELTPDYVPTGLFAPGVLHHIKIIKRDRDLFMRVSNDEMSRDYHFSNPDLPLVTEGRIGLRLMATRSSLYRNFRISRDLTPGAPGEEGVVKVVNMASLILPDQGTPGPENLEGNTTTLPFDAGPATKLVVTVSGEQSGDGTPVITYNGEQLTRAVAGVGSTLGIWYLDNPYTGGQADLTIDMTSYTTVNGIGVGVFSLAGAGPGYTTGGSSMTNSISLATVASNSLVIVGYADNSTASPTADSPMTSLYGADIGSSAGAAGRALVVTPGVNTFSFSGGQSSSARMVAASFGPPAGFSVTTGDGAELLSPGQVRLPGVLSHPSDVVLYWDIADRGTNSSAWAMQTALGSVFSGLFHTDLSNLVSGYEYAYRYYATDTLSGSNAWSAADSFTVVTQSTGTVQVVNAGSQQSPGAKSSTLSFNAGSSADKLVVAISSENSSDGPTVVTYNGVPLQLAAAGVARVKGIWYLDDPYTGGAADLVVDMTGMSTVNGIGFGVVSLSGAAPGSGVSTNAAGISADIDVPQNGSVVIGGYGENNNKAVGANAPLIELYGGNIGSAMGSAGYASSVAAGNNTFSFQGSLSDSPAVVLAAFPPPLAVGGTELDTDNDGILDAWTVTYFADDPFVSGMSTNDPDGDSFSNYDEYIAGTNPTNSSDHFDVQVVMTNGMMQVVVPTRLTTSEEYGMLVRRYCLEESCCLTTTNWIAVTGFDNVPATGNDISHTNSPAVNPVFYRAKAWLFTP